MSAFTALNGGSPKSLELPPVKMNPSSTPEDQSRPTSLSLPGTRDTIERPRLQTNAYAEHKELLKRRRSNSVDRSREGPLQEQTPLTATVPHGDLREPFGTPRRDSRRVSPEAQEKPWYPPHTRGDRHLYDRKNSSTNSPAVQPEEPNETPVQRAENQPDQGECSHTSPGADGERTSQRSTSMLPSDAKRRKRNFSNRTKTGCKTCRHRKKKCDEQKPECANCIKGGFVCQGYNDAKEAGQKQDTKSHAVPLESKDPSYVPPGAYGMAQPNIPSTFGHQTIKRETVGPYRGHVLRIDPPQGRPLVTDDDRPTASTLASASVAGSDNKLSAMPYTPANAFLTPISANTQTPLFGDRMVKDFHRAPLHELTHRSEPETPHPSNQLPQISLLHPTRTNSPAPPAPVQTSNVQVAAQLALSHPQYPTHRPTQKEEMLLGRQFYPFDKELCLERERCAAACWRFNSLTTPSNGVSSEERSRLFLEILQPRDPIRMPLAPSQMTNMGRVGRNVTVETPFTCDYGYNITIGDRVSISRNCEINDVCEVKIGDNCVIGPGVKIFTATLPIDPKRRQGGQGPQTGKRVNIEADCWIAGGATILAGITIGKGSTVSAGSIVTKDVPPYVVVAGNPARVIRGVAS